MRSESPILAMIIGTVFLFIGWYHAEDRVVAPLMLSPQQAERIEAVLVEIRDTPDSLARPRSNRSHTVAGAHDLRIAGFDGRIEFPRELRPALTTLRTGDRYVFEVQRWGSDHWRGVSALLPSAVARFLDYEPRNEDAHRMLISIRSGDEVLLPADTAIGAARDGVFHGVLMSLFFGGIGLLLTIGPLCVMLRRRAASRR